MNEMELLTEYEINGNAAYPGHSLQLVIDLDAERAYVADFADSDHAYFVDLPDARDACHLARLLGEHDVEDVVARVLADATPVDKWIGREELDLGPDGRAALLSFRASLSREPDLYMVTTEELIGALDSESILRDFRDEPADAAVAAELFVSRVESMSAELDGWVPYIDPSVDYEDAAAEINSCADQLPDDDD